MTQPSTEAETSTGADEATEPPAEVRFEHRMSDADALMWAIEKDPMLRSTITTATSCGAPSNG
jgi:hypothetical protein